MDNTNQTQTIIDVEENFGGDLEAAISSANDGDIVRLGEAKTYTTSGIVVDKDITINGQQGSVVDGGGTSNAIFDLVAGASGATIQNLEITNGNNGVRIDEATDVTLQNLEIHNIGITETIREGKNNSGITLSYADGFQILDSELYNIGRAGVGINNTDGGTVSRLNIEDINLAGENAQSYDAAGIKTFNTNDILISDNELSGINAIGIWNDITTGTTIEGNVITGVGEDFLKPDFNPNVDIFGIYNEKSHKAVIRNNEVTATDDFLAFQATEFSTQTMVLENNDFSSQEINTTDYWTNEKAEIYVAVTEDPRAGGFELFEESFFAQANISGTE